MARSIFFQIRFACHTFGLSYRTSGAETAARSSGQLRQLADRRGRPGPRAGRAAQRRFPRGQARVRPAG